MTTTAQQPPTTNAPARPPVAQDERRPVLQTLSNALLISRREVRDSFRDWRIVAPIIILTLLFPSVSQFGAQVVLNYVTQYGEELSLLGERTVPFFLMIVGFFPISLSLVIALETFVGEKERMSLEPLLSTPLTNLELYIGKTIAAMIPPLASSYVGMAVYMVGMFSGGTEWRPPLMLIIQMILLTTAHGLFMVAGAVVVSGQTTSTRAANLLASFIIVPMSLLVILESMIMFVAPDASDPNGISTLWMIILGLLVGAALLMRMGARIFNREELLGRSLDALNLNYAARMFWGHFWGQQGGGLIAWYRVEITASLRRLSKPLVVVLICLVAAALGGYIVGLTTDWQIPQEYAIQNESDLLTNFQYAFQLGASPATVARAIWQNTRVLMLGTLLSVMSFGVLGIILAILPFGILGWLFAQFSFLNIDPATFYAAVIPHSLLEVPAILLATAAALRLGAIITGPEPGLTVSTAWLRALADVVKVFVGLVLPLLVLAALVEVYITPLVVRATLGG